MAERLPVTNLEVAAAFYEVADLLEIKGVPFKPQAYRRAALALEALPEDLADVVREDRLDEIPGVGKGIADRIREFVGTGSLALLAALREELPEGVQHLTRLEGIGPKKAIALSRDLGIRTVDDLEAAAKAGRVRDLPGFGEKTEQKILESILLYRTAKGRHLLGRILPVAREIEARLASLPSVRQVSLAGSIRRRKETIGDVDILAASSRPEEVMEAFATLPGVERVLVRGPTKTSVVLATGIQVDLRVVEGGHFGAALQYFTGSKEHNIAMRKLAIARNWRLNEYGLVDLATGETVAGEDEAGIYRAFDLAWIEPELREDRGELEAARTGTLPDLVGYGAVRGDLHVHTRWSEGAHSVAEMAEAARALGYEYIAICDHAEALHIARGLSPERLADQAREIERVNRENGGEFTVLTGTECNIDLDGNLDFPDSLLADLDVVVASVHSGFNQTEREMTERVVAAMGNEHVDIIGHPTGRILLSREPYRIDLSAVSEAAATLGVLLEINAYPGRLDLSDVNVRSARGHGVSFSLGSDAHNKESLRQMEFGVAVARRGWLTPEAIANTRPLQELRGFLR
ncbi:DNA polymerase/3'-5' exonuclease PolX [Methanoculleus sp. Wushi-C6]|uniref:DNA polymerase beta n=1 Tax=Methanoculleus caldifontis TaxID=2651577 RepID=A0ABU3X3W0_9EURY|nr:DNA polymerase/3'-5' exonuclease PolX [Methanoculleus sp. Wushi-C6]MDV2482723.1 DNA polymerase/3'-5' exonuclease PolX [Methanoculleus sp. Wushi-C6]